ncbi:hypothetical protein KSP39_PZI001022 [Platanthera zijinensis]|uniref:Uncharacterized protein n=1 Tax=Platanthera zijinensis TaxID=2320716 RepID=A0AAP0GFR6_9ASPA
MLSPEDREEVDVGGERRGQTIPTFLSDPHFSFFLSTSSIQDTGRKHGPGHGSRANRSYLLFLDGLLHLGRRSTPLLRLECHLRRYLPARI